MKYCEVCCIPFEGDHCPLCGRKSKRELADEDLCYLTETEALWSEVLSDALKDNDIAFLQKNVLGAALALKTGPLRERVRFFVYYRQLEEAKKIVEELFSPPEGNMDY